MSKSTGNFLTLRQALDKFSADGMRLTLADAGDTIEDANFVEKMADAGILRLYTFHEWIKEILEAKDSLRTGDASSFNDRVFDSEINRAIRMTEANYENMMYREALKTGFYELQAARDKYREVCTKGMHRDLVFRFIEVQTLLLSPICPHLCDHIWRKIDKSGSIVDASWPVIGKEDEVLLQASAYLENITHDMRLRIKNLIAQQAKKHKGGSPPPKPNHGVIYVASSFPAWQHTTLTIMKNLYNANNGSFPDNREIMTALKDKPEVKKYMKKLMSFVQFVRGSVEKDGLSAMDTTLPFDEKQVLLDNQQYLEKSLGLSRVEIKSSSEADAKIQEDSAPGKPITVFTTQEGLTNGIANDVDKTPLAADTTPLVTPVCRYVNVQLVGTKPACGAKGQIATILLENPKGEFILTQHQLVDQVKSVFGLRDRKLALCSSSACDEVLSGEVLHLHGKTIYACIKI
ncbi:leucine--tRNA ligase, cytoplasmic-like [Actinia tenebrosa]|uniref:Leucine--tRNA ligase, cytoplasmic-like n=1 Tax=Actinia tenebrosa TaxID=6105 RepID=A0A6P8HQ88_ACTTE|nr:leucine--tRNA ligase, cytoplasmic-like [Actinia tenebrosa]